MFLNIYNCIIRHYILFINVIKFRYLKLEKGCSKKKKMMKAYTVCGLLLRQFTACG